MCSGMGVPGKSTVSSGNSGTKTLTRGIVNLRLTCRPQPNTSCSMDLRDKVVVVTGASMGIGEALARAFLRGDCKVVLSARDPGRLETARARLGAPDRSLAITCDVRNREEIDRLLSLSLHNFGRLDIWINNAGF